MDRVRDRVRRVAGTGSSVLILGEPGTGKRLVAAVIHGASPRCRRPLVTIDLTKIIPDRSDLELFGQAGTASANGDQQGGHAGRIASASGSTVLLHEVGMLGSTGQARLLRLLERRTVNPLGGHEEFPVDVRVLATSSTDLGALVDEGRFRDDLFCRLGAIEIRLPPLRNHREDIPSLIEHFVGHEGEPYADLIQTVERRIGRTLATYQWPGNVEELRKALVGPAD
jgi:DNA-binding NtrC family response regulator